MRELNTNEISNVTGGGVFDAVKSAAKAVLKSVAKDAAQAVKNLIVRRPTL